MKEHSMKTILSLIVFAFFSAGAFAAGAGNSSGADWGGSTTVTCPDGLTAKNNECNPPGKRKQQAGATTSKATTTKKSSTTTASK
jgi:hypothetical protein